VEGEELAVRGVNYSQLNNGTSGFNGVNKRREESVFRNERRGLL